MSGDMRPMTWEAVEATRDREEARRAENVAKGGFSCNRCADTGIVPAPEPYGSWGCRWFCPECPAGEAERKHQRVVGGGNMVPGETYHPLPKYQCHKQVQALKIAAIRPPDGASPNHVYAAQGAVLVPAEEGYGPFEVSGEYMNKHAPRVGGYYVVYDDGYLSFSPAQAFEEGYTRI